MRFLNALTLSLSAAAVGGCLFAVSCRDGLRAGETHLVSESWTSTENCMNGYSIVTDSTGLMGLVAEGGSLVPIRPLYSELFFLTDDLLAGYEGGQWSFLDTEGRKLAQIDGTGFEETETLLGEYRRLRAMQLDSWEKIVRGYEDFCALCTGENVSYGEMKALSDSLLREVSMAEGMLGEGQRRRIEAAFAQYKEGRGI